jgi:hypothetical protein
MVDKLLRQTIRETLERMGKDPRTGDYRALLRAFAIVKGREALAWRGFENKIPSHVQEALGSCQVLAINGKLLYY